MDQRVNEYAEKIKNSISFRVARAVARRLLISDEELKFEFENGFTVYWHGCGKKSQKQIEAYLKTIFPLLKPFEETFRRNIELCERGYNERCLERV